MKYLNEGKCDLQVGRARSGWPSGTQGLIGGSGAVTAKQKIPFNSFQTFRYLMTRLIVQFVNYFREQLKTNFLHSR